MAQRKPSKRRKGKITTLPKRKSSKRKKITSTSKRNTPKKKEIKKAAPKSKQASLELPETEVPIIPSHVVRRQDKRGYYYYWDKNLKKRVSRFTWRQQLKFKVIQKVKEVPQVRMYKNQAIVSGLKEYLFRKEKWKVLVTYAGKSQKITLENVLAFNNFIYELMDIYFQLIPDPPPPSPHVNFYAEIYSKKKIFNIQLDDTEFLGLPTEMIPVDKLFKDSFGKPFI